MKLIEVSGIPPRKRGRTNIRIMIEEFIASDMEICEIVFAESEYKSANICTATWNRAIARYGFVGLRAVTSAGHSYIQKVDLDK